MYFLMTGASAQRFDPREGSAERLWNTMNSFHFWEIRGVILTPEEFFMIIARGVILTPD